MSETTYSASKFWDKIATIPKKAHCTLIKKALILYVILTESDTPIWVTTSIITALTYLICPFDVYFDFLPGGYSDDMIVLAGLVVELSIYITPQVEQRVTDYMPDHCS